MNVRSRPWLGVFIPGFVAGALIDRLWVTDRLHELPMLLVVLAGACFPLALALGVAVWTSKR